MAICIFPVGGEYDGDRKMDDLKLLYRAYVTDSLSSGRMEENKVRNILALSRCPLTNVLTFNLNF